MAVKRSLNINHVSFIVGSAYTSDVTSLSVENGENFYEPIRAKVETGNWYSLRSNKFFIAKNYNSFKRILTSLEPIWPYNRYIEQRLVLMRLFLFILFSAIACNVLVIFSILRILSDSRLEVKQVTTYSYKEHSFITYNHYVQTPFTWKEHLTYFESYIMLIQLVMYLLFEVMLLLVGFLDMDNYHYKLNNDFDEINMVLKQCKISIESSLMDSSEFERVADGVNESLVRMHLHLNIFLAQIAPMVRNGCRLLKYQFILASILSLMLLFCNAVARTPTVVVLCIPTFIVLLIINSLLPMFAYFKSKFERSISKQILSLLANVTSVNQVVFSSKMFLRPCDALSSGVLFFDYQTMAASVFNPNSLRLWRRQAKRIGSLTDALAFKVSNFDVSKYDLIIGLNAYVLSMTLLFLKNVN